MRGHFLAGERDGKGKNSKERDGRKYPRNKFMVTVLSIFNANLTLTITVTEIDIISKFVKVYISQ